MGPLHIGAQYVAKQWRHYSGWWDVGSRGNLSGLRGGS